METKTRTFKLGQTVITPNAQDNAPPGGRVHRPSAARPLRLGRLLPGRRR
jgi:hypothetical protein